MGEQLSSLYEALGSHNHGRKSGLLFCFVFLINVRVCLRSFCPFLLTNTSSVCLHQYYSICISGGGICQHWGCHCGSSYSPRNQRKASLPPSLSFFSLHCFENFDGAPVQSFFCPHPTTTICLSSTHHQERSWANLICLAIWS